MYKGLFNLVINNNFLNTKENTDNFELIHEINLK